MSRLGLRLLTSLFFLSAAVSPVTAQPAAPVSEETVHEVAAQLRCVVCQNLSVADSPSEMASQMRALIRDRLADWKAAGITTLMIRGDLQAVRVIAELVL